MFVKWKPRSKGCGFNSLLRGFIRCFRLFANLPIIGLPGKAITAAAIAAPIIGIILGPYVGALSTILGGIIGFFAGSFSLPSLFAGAFATLCAGMLCAGKWIHCVFTYLSLLLLFGFTLLSALFGSIYQQCGFKQWVF